MIIEPDVTQPTLISQTCHGTFLQPHLSLKFKPIEGCICAKHL
ncbi:hypothetical protein MC7420_8094 [Coleofasciculus chthonoplastes PCC 7420]|uniref:Uncharacterized protein n=1 Tax=Coleofasciculus chthonoplastes PCC 7420 TaxID=118168 RepID=B4W4I9_9CYAN|nr:hypothetical protein MC7420_8094 [Coleofasciculus chthonoplastes PCC 7420]